MRSSHTTAEEPPLPAGSEDRWGGRRRWALRILAPAALAAALIAGAVLVRGGQEGTAGASRYPTSLATVTEQTLSSQLLVDGLLGYGDPVPVSSRGSGTITWLPPVGSTVERGQPLFAVDEQVVPLLYGPIPLYQPLAVGTEDGAAPSSVVRDARAAVREADLALALERERLAEAEARQARGETRQADSLRDDPETPEFIQLRAAVRAAEDRLERTRALLRAGELILLREFELQQVQQWAEAQRKHADHKVEVAEHLRDIHMNVFVSALQTFDNMSGELEPEELKAAEARREAAREQFQVSLRAFQEAQQRREEIRHETDRRLAEAQRALAGAQAGASTTPQDVRQAEDALAVARANLAAAMEEAQQARPGVLDLAAAQLAVARAERQLVEARERLQALETGPTDHARGLVRQLQENLAALGYTGFEIDGTYDAATAEAVRAWQSDLGLPVTGSVEPGEVVFMPGPVRVVEHAVRVGDALGSGATLAVTATEPVVTIALDPAHQARVSVGDSVTVTLPDRRTAEGTVSSIGSVATADRNNRASIAVEVALSDPETAAGLDQAPVSVAITTHTVEGLVAPITALVALAGGGHAVEVAHPDRRRELVPVTTGLFDGSRGLVAVTGEGLQAGQQVVVPGR